MKPISELTDAELSEAVAVEVAGFKYTTLYPPGWVNEALGRSIAGSIPPYATSFDAVLPLLEKSGCFHITFNNGGHLDPSERNWVVLQDADYNEHHGFSTSLPRAACLSLLQAVRASK